VVGPVSVETAPPTPLVAAPEVAEVGVAAAVTVPRRQEGQVVGADTLSVLLALALGLEVMRAGFGIGVEHPGPSLGLWPIAAIPIYLAAFSLYGLYRRDRRRLFPNSFSDLLYLAHALFVAGCSTLIASHVAHRVFDSVPRLSLSGAVLLSVPALVTVPLGRGLVGTTMRLRGRVRSRVIILGSGIVADSVARRLGAFDDVQLLGCVDDEGSYAAMRHKPLGDSVLGGIADLPHLCVALGADRVIVAFSPTAAPAVAETLRRLPASVQVSVVPRLFDLITWRSHVEEIHGLPLMDLAPPSLALTHRTVKRSMDLTVALGTALIGLPLWVAIAVAVKVSSPGPVFFRQLRCGRKGEAFSIYKFRTMRDGADGEKDALSGSNEVDGPLFKIKEDPRVTRVGRFLRATSLDEFPQLINVIKGDMSLVGPRPFVLSEAGRIDGWAARRFDVRPGMTGLWQVSGRNDLPFEELRRLDYAYVASWSTWWDLKIIWHTPGSVLRRRGAY